MKEFKWEISSKIRPKTEEEVIKAILSNRGIVKEEEINDFFAPSDPLTLQPEDVGISGKEITKAAKRITKAISEKEKIIVYGDYDADGICAAAILWETLKVLGAEALPYIPDRLSEGYGLNEDSIAKLKSEDKDLKLIVTVDHGIVGHKKIDFAKELGVDVIVSDHHQALGTRPDAMAVVHTTTLSGSGVSWMLAKELLEDGRHKEKTRNLLELVALGTIADLIPLVGPNRSMVKAGLEELRKTKRVGLKSLMEIAKVEPSAIGTYEVGYIITPRLNAMGRLEHAIESLRLLCTSDESYAQKLAFKMDQINRDRQLLTQETVLHARQLLLQKQTGQPASLIFLAHESYQQGVIGLVAGKLVEEFYRPTIIISLGEKYSKASARSVFGFNIIEAIREADDLLLEAGGHPMAAGFSVETAKLAELEAKLLEITSKKIGGELVQRPLKVDLELSFPQISDKLAEKLKTFEPFGQGNPEPTFASFGLKVLSARTVGADNQHLKLVLSADASKPGIEAIAFRMGELYQDLTKEALLDVVYNLTVEEWNGSRRLQLRIRDARIAKK